MALTNGLTGSHKITDPLGTVSPTGGDDQIRRMKEHYWEVWCHDHFYPRASDAVTDGDSGEHGVVTFHQPVNTYAAGTTYSRGDFCYSGGIVYRYIYATGAAGKTPATETSYWEAVSGTNKGVLYTKDVTVSETTIAELYYHDEAGNDIQLTAAGMLKPTVDDDTLELDTTNGLQVKAGVAETSGGAGDDTGLKATHCSPTAKSFVDDITLEIDDTNGIQVKDIATPSSGSDAYPDDVHVNPMAAVGRYSGSAQNQTIDVGFVIKHLIIKGSKTNTSAVEAIVAASGTIVWGQTANLAMGSWVTFTGNTFTVTGDNENVNQATYSYNFYAQGVRA